MKQNNYRIHERVNTHFHISDAKYVTQKFYDVEKFDYIINNKEIPDNFLCEILYFIIFCILLLFKVKIEKEWIVIYTYTDKKKAQRYLEFLKREEKKNEI